MKCRTDSCRSRKTGVVLFLILSAFSLHGTGAEKIFCDPLTVRPLTEKMLLLSGSCRNFYTETFRKRHSERLERLKKSPFTRKYILDMEYRAAVMDLVRDFRGKICETWRKGSSYSLYDSAGVKIPVELEAFYWLPCGYLLEIPFLEIAQYHIVYHTVLKTEKALSAGRYTLCGPFGSKKDFHWDPAVHPSALLQVKDLPCSISASRFVNGSFWSGSEKALDLTEFEGKTFEVISCESSRTVHKGRILLHRKDRRSSGGARPLRGGMLLSMDLSALQEEGRYFIRVPSLGRSQQFRITAQAGILQSRIYLSALKDLRCRYCHKETARGDFPGETFSYRKSPRSVIRGFFTPSGESFSTKISTFLHSRETKEFPLIPGVYGGWHEDPSGRKLSSHLEAVNALLSAVLYCPQNKGSALLLEEALYGLDLYRRVQTGSGAVALHVEPSPYRKGELLLSAPGRRSTLAYAQSSALAALVLREKGFHAQSRIYQHSALRAWDFASEKKNRLRGTYRSVRKGRVVLLKYYEDPELDAVRLLECGTALYYLTGEQRFLHTILAELPRIRQALHTFPEKIPFWDLTLFLRKEMQNSYLKELRAWVCTRLRERADRCLSSLPGVEEGSVEDLLVDSSILTGAWYISGDSRYFRGAWQKALVLSGLNTGKRDLILSGRGYGLPDRTQEVSRVWGLYFPADLRRKKGSYALSLLCGNDSLSRREHTKQVDRTVPAYFRNLVAQSYSSFRYGEDSFVSRLGTAAALFYLLQGEGSADSSIKK